MKVWDFPGDLVVRIQCSHCRCPGSIPGQGTKIPQAVQHSQKKKRKKEKKDGSSQSQDDPTCSAAGRGQSWNDSSWGPDSILLESTGCKANFSRVEDWAQVLFFLFPFLSPILCAFLQIEKSLFKIRFVYGIIRNTERGAAGEERERWVRRGTLGALGEMVGSSRKASVSSCVKWGMGWNPWFSQ